MKSLRKAYRGEKGFTLVELLVVVVILGVLAAVAVLAVTRFMGRGNLESATTELHQAQTAVAAAMADAGTSVIDGAVFPIIWEGEPLVIMTGAGAYDAADSILGKAFKARYHVEQNGEISFADLATTISDPWSGIQWNPGLNGWENLP